MVPIDHGHFYSRVYPREGIHKHLAEDSAAVILLVKLFLQYNV
jgi:hypothetical protein